VKRLALLFWRATRRKCPHCGNGAMFRNWLAMRESGYFTGAVAINLVVSELIFVIGMVAWIVLTWPNPPWGTLQVVGPIMVALCPIAFWPFSRTFWIAISLAMQPVERREVVPDYRTD
jgi:uncharacterized protein (DUF983 family)